MPGVRGRKLLLVVGLCLLIAGGVLALVVVYRHNQIWTYSMDVYERLDRAGFPADRPSVTIYDILLRAPYTSVPAKGAMLCGAAGLSCILVSRRQEMLLRFIKRITRQLPSTA